MKTSILFISLLVFCAFSIAQSKMEIERNLISITSDNTCECLDSLGYVEMNESQRKIVIKNCIKDQAMAYQLTSKISLSDNSKGANANNNIVEFQENSPEYKKYYNQIYTYLMQNCDLIKNVDSGVNTGKSLSLKQSAVNFYNDGLNASKNGNSKLAIENFQKAIQEDPQFALARKQLAENYIQSNQFEKAIEQYKQVLKFDPKNSEIYFDLGSIYTSKLNDLEKGLDNFCKAYHYFSLENSPKINDAKKEINSIYKEMKKEGLQSTFNQILAANNIGWNE